MARDFTSEAALAFAVATALAALASAGLLVAAIVAMRAWRRWRAVRLARRQAAWEAALHAAIDDPRAARLAPVAALDLPDFVALWTHLQESLRGRANENLDLLLRLEGLDARIMALLDRRSTRLRLLAIIALGNLREVRAWARLEALARERDAVISFAAARALIRIEAPRALRALMPSLVEREDWPLSRIGSLFQELGPDVVTGPVTNMLVARPRRGLSRAVKLARFAHRERVAPVVRGWLSASDDPEVIIAALDHVEDAAELPWVLGGARHADWRVRIAAARALGRIGGPSELAALLALLRDAVWWVRYHAAHALTRLPGLSRDDLEELRQGSRDAYAADMLAEAMASRAARP